MTVVPGMSKSWPMRYVLLFFSFFFNTLLVPLTHLSAANTRVCCDCLVLRSSTVAVGQRVSH